MSIDYQHRHDISDEAWALPEPILPEQCGQWGGIAKDNRLFIHAVFWILRTGTTWRNLPLRLPQRLRNLKALIAA